MQESEASIKIRTIALVLDLSNRRPARNGKSFLACGQQALIPLFDRLEIGDRMLLYERNGIKVCSTIGECVAAISNYKCHKFLFPKALTDITEVALSLDEEQDVWIFGITDQYQGETLFSMTMV